MGAGVADAVHGIQVGQVVAFFPGVEAEFQNLHTGIAGIQLELTDLGGHVAQILGDEVQLRQGLPDGTEEALAGAGNPLAVPGGFVPGGNGPVAFEATEMVEANHVIHACGSGQSLDPPAVAGIGHLLPVVDGIAPELTVLGESIGGTACHHFGAAVLVQLEQLRLCPDIGAVQRNVNGHVTDDADALIVGVAPQRLPLFVELILQEILQLHSLKKLLLLFCQGLGIVAFQLLRPVQPDFAPHVFLDGHEDGVVLQPAFVGF